MQPTINLAVALAILLQVELTDKLMRSKLILGLYPFIAKNGGILVVVKTLVLAANFLISSNWTQSS